MKDRKARVGAIVAFGVVLILVIAGFVLDATDRTSDVFPNENTQIYLYGEVHGYKTCYDAELEAWSGYYDEGCRALFVELPYYSAEFLNIWMKEEDDALIDVFFEEIQGTQSGNDAYYTFFHEIKARCPETVFYGTDIGHQYDTTGARYLRYLTEKGLADSENYRLAEECIRQGQAYYNEDSAHNGVSALREGYMVSNFAEAFARSGSGKIMGIYGDYHTNLENPDLMAGRLRAQYGDIISSVKVSTLALARAGKPYALGFCVTGVVFLLMLFVPNMLWARGAKPTGYEESAKRENRVLLALERIGEGLVSVSLLIFPALNPRILVLGGVFFSWKLLIWVTAFVLMLLYECYWVKYFGSGRTMRDFYMSFAGFPVAGATLPVVAVLLLGIYAGNAVVIGAAVILGIGHIGIHLMHRKELA